MGTSATPRPPWQPGAEDRGASPGGAGGSMLAPRPALAAAVALGAAAVVAGAAWWAFALATLTDAGNDGRCSTRMPDGAATDLLLPAHAVVAVLLLLAAAVLAAARPASGARTARAVTLGVVALLSLLMLVPAEPALFVLLGAAAAGVVLGPLGVVAAVAFVVAARRRTGAASTGALLGSVEVLVWPLLVSGPALSALWANLTFSDLFCF